MSQLVSSVTDQTSAFSKQLAHHRACLDGSVTEWLPSPSDLPFPPLFAWPSAMRKTKRRGGVVFLVACQSWLDRHKAGTWPSLAQTPSLSTESSKSKLIAVACGHELTSCDTSALRLMTVDARQLETGELAVGSDLQVVTLASDETIFPLDLMPKNPKPRRKSVRDRKRLRSCLRCRLRRDIERHSGCLDRSEVDNAGATGFGCPAVEKVLKRGVRESGKLRCE